MDQINNTSNLGEYRKKINNNISLLADANSEIEKLKVLINEVNQDLLNTISILQTDLSNAKARINELEKHDYVIEYGGTTANWYRLYKSGWLVQGGSFAPSSTGSKTITFNKSYSSKEYTIHMSVSSTRTSAKFDNENNINSQTASSFTYYEHSTISAVRINWEAKGWSA